jgi:hypothetical protein
LESFLASLTPVEFNLFFEPFAWNHRLKTLKSGLSVQEVT